MDDEDLEMEAEILAAFLTESNEGLDSIEQQFMDLEADPGDQEILGSIFRAVHTIKGSCGFLGLDRLEKVAHAGENLLGKLRSTFYPADADIISLLLETTDALKEYIVGLEADGNEPELDHSALIRRLSAAEKLIDALSASPSTDGNREKAEKIQEPPQKKPTVEPEETPEAQGIVKIDDEPEQILEAEPVAAAENLPDPEPEGQGSPPQRSAPMAVKQGKKASSPAVRKASKQASRPASATIRVDLGLLDSMMNQVSELVLSRNRLMQLTVQSGDNALIGTSRDINHITEQLQGQLLRTRMQPISTIWGTVPRVVRDIGKQLNKRIRVVMEGQETELDRTILAALKDPLTHIIRNSCDHGIETPDVRSGAGKGAEGTLHLEAAQESGFIIITIKDDGGGIDAERVKAKAVNMGVITQDQAASMSHKAGLQLIFNAGLSTAEKVSNFSGRGVGMDVVRTEIEKVGGTIDLSSEVGQGTVLKIRIPLTLAIITAMIVGCGEHRFAIPQMNVQELLSAHHDSEHWRTIAGQSFFRLRGQLLPVMKLDETLRIAQPGSDQQRSIVVVNIGDRQMGVAVDTIYGSEEIVVKPLGIHFQHLDIYGGCSILGDGRIVPILECNGLGRLMHLSQEAEAAQGMLGGKEATENQRLQHIIVFIHNEQRYAIPMVLVERLECFDPGQIESSGGREILQYRDKLIPVLRWGAVIDRPSSVEQDKLFCLILSDDCKRLCLQVDEIDEIMEIPMDIRMDSSHPFFLGTAVIHDKATEVVDVSEIIHLADPDWFSSQTSRQGNEQRKRILFVEDSAFFRNLIIPMLEALHYDILSANDGLEACAILEQSVPDLVLTDIEMPNMDGYELAAWIRGRAELRDVPVVALTSKPPDENDTEHRANFNDILVKFDRNHLIEHLVAFLDRKRGNAMPHIEAAVIQ